ncbi:MAG: type II secretion system F family protein [Bacteroidia bacterium]|nr:type II secretion system F family protein [Bacteroidia bacterium]
MKIESYSNPYASNITASTRQKSEKESIWEKDIQLGPPWSMKDKQQFFYLLGTLIQSGLGILDALIVLKDQFNKKRIQGKIAEIQHGLEAGLSLSNILESMPAYFNSFDVQSLRMGEKTGRLAEMLDELGQFYQKRLELKRKLTQALSYPVSVIFVAGLVLAFMLNFVVPMFQDIFKRFDADLPPVTNGILALSTFLQQNGGIILLCIAFIVGTVLLVRKKEIFRRGSAWLLMKIPFFGPMILKLHLARMAYSLGLLLTAKVNLDQALEITSKLISFYPIQVALVKVKEEVIQGVSFFQALHNQGLFPSYILQMVKVGEKTAKLDELLARTANQLEAESQSTIGQLTQFLEPVLIIVLGGMVAVILVAMYLPMFELGNAVLK